MNEPQFDLDVVLSLFDGISCGQMALKRAGLTPRVYYASEVEKSPMHITKKNFPSTIMLGDVRNVVADDLPHVNLLMGGSPCTGFSFAGKGLAFDDPRSALFFEFVRLLKECSPDYFLLENVMMKKEFKDIITEHLGVEPVMINSALVSAQNRKRLYWTNIPGVGQPDDLQIDLVDVLEEDATEPMLSNIYGGFNEKKPRVHTGKSVTIRAASGGGHIPSVTIKQPEDKGILLKDVLEDGIASDEMTTKGKSYCLTARYSGAVAWNSIERKQRTMVEIEPKVLCEDSVVELNENQKRKIDKINTTTDKSNCITTAIGRGGSSTEYLTSVKKKTLALDEKVLCGRIVGRKINPETGKRDDYNPKLKRKKRIEARLDEKSGTLTTVQTDNVLIVTEATKKGYTEIEDGDCFDATFMSSKTRRGRNMKDKSNCLTAANYDYMRYEHPTYRKLTVLECSRLQTLPDSYLQDCYDEKGKEISNTQKYKALGNGWTVDVIVHILQGLKWQS